VIQGYGASECAPLIASNRLDQRLPSSAGRAAPGVQLRLAEDGEILV
jgi:long-chain acyl-CoA synthetase